MADLQALESIVGKENVSGDQLELLCYSRDMSVHTGVPDAVVRADTVEQVQQIVRLANEHGWPVTVRGAGTSVTGAILPIAGGIILDLSPMNRIKEIRPGDMVCVVEPGVICNDLNAALAPHGIFFPPDPGSSPVCTVGGMAALNASGLRAVKYGTTKDYVLATEVVLASGEVVRTGRAVPKTSSGLDLTRLMVTSEGTLGIMTELTLKLLALPEFVAFATASFDDTEQAGEAVSEMLSSGIQLAACEIMDRNSIRVINQAAGGSLPEVDAMLIMEIDGHKETVLDQVQRLTDICKKHHATAADWSDDPAFRAQMWKGRKGLVPSLSRLEAGKRLIPVAEDLGVPISKIPAAFTAVAEISQRHDFLIATFGHVGDGNIHTVFIGDVRSRDDWKVIREVGNELVDLTLSLDGTLTAEHGVGITRSALLQREHPGAISVMRAVKKALDPKGILNPGKVGLDDRVSSMFDHFAFHDVEGRGEALTFFSKHITDEVLGCVQCGFCRAACPVFGLTVPWESRNARGRVNLAFNLLSGHIEPSQALTRTFYECTQCMNCTARCPSAIKVNQIVAETRVRLAEAGFMPKPHKAVSQRIAEAGNPFGAQAADRVTSLKDVHKKHVSAEPIPGKTLVFSGCIPSIADMKTMPATFELMERLGISFASLGEKERCCAYPEYLSGNPDFSRIAKDNAAQLNRTGCAQILTPCAGCLKSLRQVYPTVEAGLEPEVVHLVEVLDREITEGKLDFTGSYKAKVAYHDPCDLGRHMSIYDPPRRVLEAVPGVELLEFQRNRNDAACCGGGGGLSVVEPELSVRVAAARVQQALDIGADVVCSACASCKDSLKKGAAYLRKQAGAEGKPKPKIKVMDLSEVVLKAL